VKDFFKPEDFFSLCEQYYAYEVCNQANEKLNKLIESWPVVEGVMPRDDFWPGRMTNSGEFTHRARLAFIEEIKKEPCKHEPTWSDDPTVSIVYQAKCKHCGIPLEAEWRAK
jgi:hypothetical protein